MNVTNDELNEAYRRTVVIGGAMMSTLVAYVVVAVAIESTLDPFDGFASLEDGGLLRSLFLGLSLFQVVAIKIIRSRALRSSGPLGSPAVAKTGERSPLVSRLISTSVVTFALAESIAVYGLVLFFLNGESTDFSIFLALSFLTFIMFFPKYHQWEQWLQEQQSHRAL